MTLKALKQPFRSTFQPLPSTPTPAHPSPKPSTAGTGKLSKRSFFSRAATQAADTARGVTAPSPNVSDKGSPKSPAEDSTTPSGTFHIQTLDQEHTTLPILISQPQAVRPRNRLLKRPPQPAPKSPPAAPRIADTNSKRFDTWTPGSSGSRLRRANKAALALRHVLLDINFEGDVAVPPHPTFTGCETGSRRGANGKGRWRAEGATTRDQVVGLKLGQGSKKAPMVPRLRGKDVERLQTQLLKPETAGMVIASARTLSGGPRTRLRLDALEFDTPCTISDSGLSSILSGAEPRWAVCLDVDEPTADDLLVAASKTERARRAQSDKLAEDRYGTIKRPPAPPARLPIILSLLEAVPKLSDLTHASDADGHASVLLLGLMQPPSAMSLHRPLAGALPTAETLRRGFDALLNAESKVYKYQGPSHRGLYPPSDRMSVFTYWWGFELAMPPPTLEYLSQVKQISTSLLNLLGIIVYAVPGGTRELAPFVGVLTRFIETEWTVLKAQDRGKGVVCGATWFIPAAIVARPWDFDLPPGSIPPKPVKKQVAPVLKLHRGATE